MDSHEAGPPQEVDLTPFSYLPICLLSEAGTIIGELFETMLDHKISWFLFFILKRERSIFPLSMTIYVTLHITFDIELYSITRSCMIRQ